MGIRWEICSSVEGKVDILRRFAAHIRRVRIERGISQEAFAFECGIDRSYLSGIECGKRNPTAVVLIRMADNLGMTMSSFFAGFEAELPHSKDQCSDNRTVQTK
jgi:transcriptional regulator with XRE-family HTH domain